MQGWIVTIMKGTVRCIDLMALAVLFIGTVQAFINGLRVMLAPSATNHQRRGVWLQYSRWLIYGLTFQLAADIIETSLAPSWNEIGQLAAIAAIRTFLEFFLEHDIGATRERDKTAQQRARGSSPSD
jgi:uncharacterized membrane protein